MDESTNKTLIHILKRIIFENKRNCHKSVVDALLESQLTPKKSTKQSTYTLVYVKEARMPMHMELKALAMVIGI
jgi:hypothetical protein